MSLHSIQLAKSYRNEIQTGAGVQLSLGQAVTPPPPLHIMKLHFCLPQLYQCNDKTAMIKLGGGTMQFQEVYVCGGVQLSVLKGWLDQHERVKKMQLLTVCKCCAFSPSCKASRAATGYSLVDQPGLIDEHIKHKYEKLK